MLISSGRYSLGTLYKMLHHRTKENEACSRIGISINNLKSLINQQ